MATGWEEHAEYWKARCKATEEAAHVALDSALAHLNAEPDMRNEEYLRRQLEKASTSLRLLRKGDKATMGVYDCQPQTSE